MPLCLSFCAKQWPSRFSDGEALNLESTPTCQQKLSKHKYTFSMPGYFFRKVLAQMGSMARQMACQLFLQCLWHTCSKSYHLSPFKNLTASLHSLWVISRHQRVAWNPCHTRPQQDKGKTATQDKSVQCHLQTLRQSDATSTATAGRHPCTAKTTKMLEMYWFKNKHF